MLLTVHPDIGLMVVENVAKIVYDCLVHARQHLIADCGLEAMYHAHRAYSSALISKRGCGTRAGERTIHARGKDHDAQPHCCCPS